MLSLKELFHYYPVCEVKEKIDDHKLIFSFGGRKVLRGMQVYDRRRVFAVSCHSILSCFLPEDHHFELYSEMWTMNMWISFKIVA